jgi:hypothetical protein
MSRAYQPDSWVIVLLDSQEHGKVYKVLASWYGGYTTGDSWKLSSGIEGVDVGDVLYTMPQSSGSTYLCHKNNEHMSGIMAGIYSSFVQEAEEAKTFTISLVKMSDFLELQA